MYKAMRTLRGSMYDTFRGDESAFADYVKVHKVKHKGMRGFENGLDKDSLEKIQKEQAFTNYGGVAGKSGAAEGQSTAVMEAAIRREVMRVNTLGAGQYGEDGGSVCI